MRYQLKLVNLFLSLFIVVIFMTGCESPPASDGSTVTETPAPPAPPPPPPPPPPGPAKAVKVDQKTDCDDLADQTEKVDQETDCDDLADQTDFDLFDLKEDRQLLACSTWDSSFPVLRREGRENNIKVEKADEKPLPDPHLPIYPAEKSVFSDLKNKTIYYLERLDKYAVGEPLSFMFSRFSLISQSNNRPAPDLILEKVSNKCYGPHKDRKYFTVFGKLDAQDQTINNRTRLWRFSYGQDVVEYDEESNMYIPDKFRKPFDRWGSFKDCEDLLDEDDEVIGYHLTFEKPSDQVKSIIQENQVNLDIDGQLIEFKDNKWKPAVQQPQFSRKLSKMGSLDRSARQCPSP